MKKHSHHIRKYIFSYVNLLILTSLIISVLGMLYSSPADLGGEFILTNISIFLIIAFLNDKLAFVVLAVFSSIVLFLSTFSYTSFIQVLEIYFVWIFFVKLKKSILISDLLFWLILGLPILFISSYYTNKAIGIQGLYLIIMITINRLFNALLADIIVTYSPINKSFPRFINKPVKISFSIILTHLCVASVITPVALFTIINNYKIGEDIKQAALKELNYSYAYIQNDVKDWNSSNWLKLSLDNPLQKFYIINILNSYSKDQDKYISFEIRTKDKAILQINNTGTKLLPLNWNTKGVLSKISENAYIWSPSNKTPFVGSDAWMNSLYVLSNTINGVEINASIPISTYSNLLFDSSINLLKVMIIIAILIFFFAFTIKRIVFNNINKLVTATSDLPTKLKNREQINFESSNIAEIDSLIQNFKSMTNNLYEMISDFQNVNAQLMLSEELLYRQAHYDFLTDLPNRYYFINQANNLINKFNNKQYPPDISGIAFLLMDLDKFKKINDTIGHDAGDNVLKIVSKRIISVLNLYPSADSFPARLGGDEFIIVFTYIKLETVHELINTLQGTIHQPFIINNENMQIGASIGISLYPTDGDNLNELFKNSDKSMYEAKAHGGNNYHFH